MTSHNERVLRDFDFFVVSLKKIAEQINELSVILCF